MRKQRVVRTDYGVIDGYNEILLDMYLQQGYKVVFATKMANRVIEYIIEKDIIEGEQTPEIINNIIVDGEIVYETNKRG